MREEAHLLSDGNEGEKLFWKQWNLWDDTAKLIYVKDTC